MIQGMTGFGCNDFSSGKTKGTIEIKSVNHRYLDIGYFLPTGFSVIEAKIRDLLSREIERGRITVSIKMTSKPTPNVSFNREAVKTYLKYTSILQKDFGLKGDLPLSQLIGLPGVVDARETMINPEELWPGMEKSFRKAIDSLLYMRRREGISLAKEINQFLNRMLLQINKIQARANLILKQKKRKFTDEEFTSFEKNADINEELSRLKHHIEEFQAFLRSNVAVGKKLDFIAQEMQREANTIGAKLPDKVVSKAVIALKSKIEKIREQSQNIE